MEKNNLNWKITSMPSWVTVSNNEGSGDGSLRINVENASGYTTDVTGTVVVSCTSCENPISSGITVCRCSCDCNVIKSLSLSIEKTIGEEGLPEDTLLATYNASPSRCNNSLITAELVNNTTQETSQLRCENGNIYLINKLPYNQSASQIDYRINVYFDKLNNPVSECKYTTFSQKGINCECDSAIKGKITYSNYFNGSSKIPQTGLTAGTELFTFKIKQYCPENLLTAKIKYGISTTRNVTISNEHAILAESIGQNDGNERDINLEINYNGVNNCETASTKQKGCECSEFFEGEDSFSAEVSTFGVTNGMVIGHYIKKNGTTCPDSKIKAYLEHDSVIYPLICSNGEVIFNGDNNIVMNKSHNDIPFLLSVYYGDEINEKNRCDSDTIYQKGVACNCGDVTISNFNKIPKDGAEIGFVLGTYSFNRPNCNKNCVKIREINNSIGVELNNENKIVTTTRIEPNGDAQKTYTFEIKYNLNCDSEEEILDDCGTIPAYQQGLECSCESIEISTEIGEDEWAIFPYAGTHGEWVPFASGDTGLYSYKGTEQQKLFGVCGRIDALCESEYLVEENGRRVKVVETPLTDEEAAIIRQNQGDDYVYPHKFTLLANIRDISDEIPGSDVLTIKVQIIFYKNEGGGVWTREDCNEKECKFKLKRDACDCSSTLPDLSTWGYEVPCEGTNGVKTLGIIRKTNLHESMSIAAELVDLPDGKPTLINNFSYGYDRSGNFNISGSVENSNIPGDPEREVGKVKLSYVCNSGKTYEWRCNDKTAIIKQEACPKCNCDYIYSYMKFDRRYSINMDYDSDDILLILTDYFKLDCGILYISGQDEEGWYDGGWFKAKLEKREAGTDYSWELNVALKDGEHHVNGRNGTVLIKFKYIDSETGDEIDCQDSLVIDITDVACDCNSISGFDDNPIVTISAGSTLGQTLIGTQTLVACVDLYILADGTKYYAKDSLPYDVYRFTDPDNPNIVFDTYLTYTDNGDVWLYAQVINGPLEKDYHITIKGEYTDYNETVIPCDKEIDAIIRQESCECKDFKKSIKETDIEVFDPSLSRLNVATINDESPCGNGRLYVFYDNVGYSSTRDEGFPTELNFITSINGCEDGEGCCGKSFYLDVTPMSSEDPMREISLGICRCDNENNAVIASNECQCLYEFSVKQGTVYDCDDTNCNDFALGLTQVATYVDRDERTLVATYNKLPEHYENCFRLSITCNDDNVKKIEPYEEYNNNMRIYVTLKDDAVPDSPIQIDANVYYLNTLCYDEDITIYANNN